MLIVICNVYGEFQVLGSSSSVMLLFELFEAITDHRGGQNESKVGFFFGKEPKI